MKSLDSLKKNNDALKSCIKNIRIKSKIAYNEALNNFDKKFVDKEQNTNLFEEAIDHLYKSHDETLKKIQDSKNDFLKTLNEAKHMLKELKLKENSIISEYDQENVQTPVIRSKYKNKEDFLYQNKLQDSLKINCNENIIKEIKIDQTDEEILDEKIKENEIFQNFDVIEPNLTFKNETFMDKKLTPQHHYNLRKSVRTVKKNYRY